MAQGARKIELDPVELLAERLVARKQLAPPIDVELLANELAVVEFTPIPFALDGVTLNLKSLDRKPHIIVNSNRVRRRQRFTLAHEIGHIIIPWHIHSILDIADPLSISANADVLYWRYEREANLFAAELLMPNQWISSLVDQKRGIEETIERVVIDANVSPPAGTLRLIRMLPPGYIVAELSPNGEVERTLSSDGTVASRPASGQSLDPYSYFESVASVEFFEIESYRYCWWIFSDELMFRSRKIQDGWRSILELILEDIGIVDDAKQHFRQSINGVFGNANGAAKRIYGNNYKREHLKSYVYQRMAGNTKLSDFASHPRFEEFVEEKVSDLFSDQ